MSDTHISDDAFINSIIGEGTRFKGEFDLNGLLRIDGDFTGVIRTKGKVLVGQNGRAECTLHAGTVVIGGVVRGEVFSTEKVIILSTGLMLGNVTTPRLIVEEGVILNGSCTITAPAADAAGVPSGAPRQAGNGARQSGAKSEWAAPPRESLREPPREPPREPASAPGQKR
jgi:cytoskeletal protein CcmA (bactofilin family)